MLNGDAVYLSDTQWIEAAKWIFKRFGKLHITESDDGHEWGYRAHRFAAKWSSVPKSIVKRMFQDAFEFGFWYFLLDKQYERLAQVCF